MRRLSTTQMIALGFFTIIMLGAGILMLPLCQRQETSYLDALFTATSAVCVTGLVTVETGTHWSVPGQMVILLLIQIGGLGFMAMASLLITASGRKTTLKERLLIQEGVGQDQLQGLAGFSIQVCRIAFLWEALGTVLLSFRLIPLLGFGRGLFNSLFLAVSAFCNAGFDVLGNGNSIACFSEDPYVLTVLMILIIAGGLGFMVMLDIGRNRRSFSRLQLHTKLVLTATGALLALGFLFFLIGEGQHAESLAAMHPGKRILNALFQSVTLRTAGFATFDQNSLSQAGKVVSAIWMFIGASPASTGGGIKTTTMACLMISVYATLRGQEHVNVFRRRLPMALILRAVAIVTIALGALIFCSLALAAVEHGHDLDILCFENYFYESASALGTTGLSTGITGLLRAPGKLLLILAMFMGRVGPLSLTLALSARLNREEAAITYPEERIIVG